MGMKEVNKFKQPLGGDNAHCIHVVWQPPPPHWMSNQYKPDYSGN